MGSPQTGWFISQSSWWFWKELLTPRSFPGAVGCQHTSPSVLVHRQLSLLSPTRDNRLRRLHALSDQITWPKVSQMMGQGKVKSQNCCGFTFLKWSTWTNNIFTSPEPEDPLFFFLQSSLWERCSRIFFPRNKLRTTLTLQQNYKHWEHMCIIWLKAQTEKVSLKMPRSYLLVISRLKYHSTLSSRTPPSHQQIWKAPQNAQSMLQAKQNWAVGFVNIYLGWGNDHYCIVVWHQEFEQEELHLLCCKLKANKTSFTLCK